jgi:asparagine synthetase B (glutamine-hydrolysing)
MRGIAGIFETRKKRQINRSLLKRMTTALAHRGQDGAGFHLAPGFGLSHRRLTGGDKSTFNDDGSNGALCSLLCFSGFLRATRADNRTAPAADQRAAVVGLRVI